MGDLPEGRYINLGALKETVERHQGETMTISTLTIRVLLDELERLREGVLLLARAGDSQHEIKAGPSRASEATAVEQA